MPSGPVSARRAPIYVRSRTQAAPRPPAAQMEISAVFSPFSSSSRSAWCTRRAPVAAKGWPSAMLPPRGFSFSSGTSPMGSAPPRCSSANFFELQAWSSKKFADEHLGGAEPIGDVPDEKLNPRGGSIALGHPFAATGARLVHQALRELDEKGENTALISICAAGGLGAACVLERT